jgi:hypothetical protein
MRKTIKKRIAGEIPAIRVSPFQIFYQHWLVLSKNIRPLNPGPSFPFAASFWYIQGRGPSRLYKKTRKEAV